MNKNGLWWNAPEYFSRWRLFPRAFISMYIYLLYDVVQWFMALPDPNTQQAGLVSVLVGSGAAWFGLYVNSSSTKFESVEVRSGNTTIKSVDSRDTARERSAVSSAERAEERYYEEEGR
jgi:hypothetical protein